MGGALNVVQRVYDAFAAGGLDAADGLFADDCRFVMPPGPLTKNEHRMMAAAFRGGLPDARMVIEHVVDGGDEVVVEGHFVGTHTGDLASPQGTLPPSGRCVNVRFADYFKTADGKITDHRTYWDQAEMMGQLGAG